VSTHIHNHALGLTWHEQDMMARAAHAVREGGHVWLIDPFEDAAALKAATELGEVSAVIQLLDRHNRDCEPIAARLGVPLLRLPAQVAGGPFTVISVISRPWWREVALWWPDQRALIVAEAIGTSPMFALDRPLGVHPMLRLTPPGALRAHQPERVLVGHGPPVEMGGEVALSQALAGARADIPKLLLKLPSLIRSGGHSP
jgi:hypothetical protein